MKFQGSILSGFGVRGLKNLKTIMTSGSTTHNGDSRNPTSNGNGQVFSFKNEQCRTLGCRLSSYTVITQCSKPFRHTGFDQKKQQENYHCATAFCFLLPSNALLILNWMSSAFVFRKYSSTGQQWI